MFNRYTNVDENLSNEQFYALVLAYNDNLAGRTIRDTGKMMINDTSSYKFNKLSDNELACLELARKSDVSGKFSEEDVVNKISVLCCKDVRDVLEQDKSHGQKLNALHNLAVDKKLNGSKLDSDKLYDNYSKYIVKAESCRKIYGSVCEEIAAADRIMKSDTFKNLDADGLQTLVDTRVENEMIASHLLFTQAYYEMNAAIRIDCFNSINQISEADYMQAMA